MEDFLYSKELDQHLPTRLDLLLYAHDGRGLGHASRAIGIGMAVRRLYPNLRVLFVSGANISQSLIGKANLDWIKLPSYASRISNGVSTGIDGPANFNKFVLEQHRRDMLAQIISSFRPKCVLVDHSPLGKRKELLAALELSKAYDTHWILGLRAVIGTQKDFWSEEIRDTFQEYYRSIFWYGDKKVVGPEHIERITSHFGHLPTETGYVSRLYETKYLLSESQEKYTGIVSLPWLSEASYGFIHALKEALVRRDKNERWKIFVANDELQCLQEIFTSLSNCKIEPVGERYAKAILNAKMAIVYGGYNSLMDIIAAQLPAIIIRREMKDQEQNLHIRQLLNYNPGSMIMVEESHSDVEIISQAITDQLKLKKRDDNINIGGSAFTAGLLHKLLAD